MKFYLAESLWLQKWASVGKICGCAIYLVSLDRKGPALDLFQNQVTETGPEDMNHKLEKVPDLFHPA